MDYEVQISLSWILVSPFAVLHAFRWTFLYWRIPCSLGVTRIVSHGESHDGWAPRKPVDIGHS